MTEQDLKNKAAAIERSVNFALANLETVIAKVEAIDELEEKGKYINPLKSASIRANLASAIGKVDFEKRLLDKLETEIRSFMQTGTAPSEI